jgi:fructokinase
LPYFRDDPLASAQVRALEASLAPRQCYCGRSNCVETFLSGPGLVRLHRELWGEALTAPEIAAASATRTDATMALYTTLLARSLAQVVNVLDPEVVVLGGGLSNVPSLYSTVTATWATYVFSSTVRTRLVAPQHGDAGGVRGAAWLWPAS